jgi:predicted TIM-barrel fold metal-dependent hydrolase
MMDAAGIDAGVSDEPPGMCVDTALSRLINDKTKAAEKDYPGRFIGGAHANPLRRARTRCASSRAARSSSGFPGVVITPRSTAPSSDDPALGAVLERSHRLGMFVFVHPALKLNYTQPLNGYDMARSIGPRVLG